MIDDVVMGCVMQAATSRQHRPQRRARRRLARVGAGDDDRPPVRVVAAGDPLRRPGRHGRRLRHRRGGRRRVDVADPDGLSVVRDVGFPFGPRTTALQGARRSRVQGIAAEMIADQWEIRVRTSTASGRSRRSGRCGRRGRSFRQGDRPAEGARRRGARHRRDPDRDEGIRPCHDRGDARQPEGRIPRGRRQRSPPATPRRSPTVPPLCS